MKICRARPQHVFTFDNRFSSTGWAVPQTFRYRIFRLQASYLSATSHTGRKSYRVKSLCMKRFWFVVWWQWSGDYSGQLLLPAGCAVVRGVRVELTMLGGEVTLITPPTPVPRVRLLQVCSFYTNPLSENENYSSFLGPMEKGYVYCTVKKTTLFSVIGYGSTTLKLEYP
jgi:hypothetical protein